MADLATGAPSVPQAQLVDSNGIPTVAWYSFFVTLWQRTGGANASLSPLLDIITSFPGAMIYRGAQVWTGLKIGQRYQVLRAGLQFPEWDFLDGNSFGDQPASSFFVTPTAAAGVPAFRQIETADLDPVAGQLPGTTTNDDAAADNVGEYLSAEVLGGAALPLASGVAKDIVTLVLTPGDWDIWGTIGFASGGATDITIIETWMNTVSVTPGPGQNGGAFLYLAASLTPGNFQVLPVGQRRVSVAKGTTQIVYLSANVTFTTSTLSGYGFIGARRRR